MALSALGWDDFFASHLPVHASPDLVPARVAIEHKHAYVLLSARGELSAGCTGRLLHTAHSRDGLPAVGDWVIARLRPGETPASPGQTLKADIHAVLPRRTKFSRRAAGPVDSEQIVAANIDTVFVVTALDQNFNLRRIERYLAAAWESGAQPVVVLNKADLHPDPAAAQAEVETIASGAPVVTLSALPRPDHAPVPVRSDVTGAIPERTPRERLGRWLAPGRTIAFLGSSGVGKSTLINRLLGADRQRTSTLSEAVGKGRHTTTQRELIVAPDGWLVIDTPGMRELQFWDVAAGALDATFADIAALTAMCRFSDCTHRAEPGCAVQSALDAGTLDEDRWRSFQKLQREQAYAARKVDPRLAREERAVWKKRHRQLRARDRFEKDE